MVSDAKSCSSLPSWPAPGVGRNYGEMNFVLHKKALGHGHSLRERRCLSKTVAARGYSHGAGLRRKCNLALSGILLSVGNNSSWIPYQEISKEHRRLAYVKDIRCINMLLGDDRNKYSNQRLGSYQPGSWCIRREITFSLEMHSMCSDLYVWFWSHKWRCAEVDRGDSFSHMENWIITTIPFVKKGWKLRFQFWCKAGTKMNRFKLEFAWVDNFPF